LKSAGVNLTSVSSIQARSILKAVTGPNFPSSHLGLSIRHYILPIFILTLKLPPHVFNQRSWSRSRAMAAERLVPPEAAKSGLVAAAAAVTNRYSGLTTVEVELLLLSNTS
jgi:hypothetical protein